MPVNFLTAEQAAQYGRYAGEPSPAQLAQYFFLDDADRAFLRALRQEETQWGCAVQLGTVRFLGTFVDDPGNIPERWRISRRTTRPRRYAQPPRVLSKPGPLGPPTTHYCPVPLFPV